MSFLNLLSYLFLLAFLINFVAPVEATGAVYLDHNCSSTKNFTSDPAYRFNLNALLSSLSSYAAGTPDFYNATAGDRSTSNAVYGLFMCRGDVPSQVCQDCVGNATNRLLSDSKCPFSEEGVVWYDECLVRFSDRYFFTTVDERPKLVLQNASDVPNQESIRRVLATALNDTVVEAARSGPQGTKKFATRQANLSESQSVFSVAQCTPDLSEQDCKKCLNDAVQDLPECCVGKQGGRVMYPSCFLKFAFYRFYDIYNAAPQPHPELPPYAPVSTGKVTIQ